MDGLGGDRFEQRRGLRERLAADVGGHAAHDLEQTGAARIDDPRLLEHVELLGRGCESFLAVSDEVAERILDGGVGAGDLFGPLGQGTGNGEDRSLLWVANGGVAGVARCPQGARQGLGVEGAPSSGSAERKPRASCERMTPEFPRAPIRIARPTSASASRSSASATARTVIVMFVPVSPSGTG